MTKKAEEKAPAAKKAAPIPKKTKPVESIGLKAMRGVDLNATEAAASDAAAKPAPKQVRKAMTALPTVNQVETVTAVRDVEIVNGRISLDSALARVADQRNQQSTQALTPQVVESPFIKELSGLLRK